MEKQKISSSFPRAGFSKVLFSLLLTMALMLNVPHVAAQNPQTTVTGTVQDAMGPVIGASIMEKGSTSNGTITDIDGNFSIKVKSGATLVVSFIGYKTQELTLQKGQTNLKVTLAEDSEMLEEVVVVGYGSMRKKDVTGSVIQIRPEKLANEAPKTVQDVLRGTPGLNVGYDSSAKGGGSMQIRGQRSVYTEGGHNDPLIILDGMMFYGELSEINTADIAQIDVLKDASSAAVYGAKAANGVIIITTKKGRKGKPTINVSSTLGINTRSAYREAYDAAGYMQYREDWYKAGTYGVNPQTGAYEAYQAVDGKGNLLAPAGYYDRPENLGKYGVSSDQWAAYTKNEAGDSMEKIYARRLNLESAVLDNYLLGKTTDWDDLSFRTGINQDYTASISGAGDRMSYYMSVGYLKNEGVKRGNDYDAIRANLKVSGQVTNWLEIGANVNFQDRSDGDLAVDDGKMLDNSPYSNYRNEDGSYAQYPMGADKQRGYNYDFERPYIDLEKGYTVLNTIFNAKLTLPWGIKYEFNVAPRYQFFFDRYFTSAARPDTNPNNQGTNREQSKRFDWSLNNTITWDYTFAKKHHVLLTLVQEAEERRFWKDRIEARGIFPSDAQGLHGTGNGTKTLSSFSTNDTHETAAAYMGRVFYSYDDRYMLTATLRRDGYCAFGSNNPWANFPSISAAWAFTNEKFFNWAPMSTGKFRLSWGKNGNRSLEDPYIALADLAAGMGKTMGYIDASGNKVDVKYLTVGRLANPNLQWEKTEAFNIGLDFGFLNDRITGTAEYYIMKTHDMIMKQKLPIFSGFDNMTTNLGEVQNRGFELSLSTLNIQKKDFEWRTSLGFSIYSNKIKHLDYEYEDVLDDAGNVIGRKEMDNETNGWFIGKAIGTIYDYEVDGIWQANEATEAAKVGQRPGDPKVINHYTADDKVDADGNRTPVYNDNDKVFLGKKNPPIHWSLRNEFKLWKNLDISFSLYSYMGHKSTEGYYLNQDNGSSGITYNFNTRKKHYWTLENPTNDYGRLDAHGPDGAPGVKKLYNRSFIRLDNISVAYSLPQEWTKKWQIERVKLFGTVRNVATWAADWEYADPETGGLATRTYTFGLSITL